MALRWHGRAFVQHIQEKERVKLEELAERALGVATSLVAVDTGALKSSLFARKNERERTVTVGFPVRTGYGIFVELGTRYMPARPFLRPALDSLVEI